MLTLLMQIQLPKIILGTSTLGNLYQALPQQHKTEIIREFISHSAKPFFFDSAGKYGAGLALESLGIGLRELAVPNTDVVISNKLGWYRTELKSLKPGFEADIWQDLKFDAVQKMGYDGILQCYEQGNELLNGYPAQLVSVHDPDEYLVAATDKTDESKRYKQILEAYSALFELKKNGQVQSVGVGAKDWRTIQRLYKEIKFDWVMIANSMTVHSHPKELFSFMQLLEANGVAIINAAVFNGGFLTGGDFYNYKSVSHDTAWGEGLLRWRNDFFSLCREFKINPANAAMQFGMNAPGVKSIAVSSADPLRIKDNIDMIKTNIPAAFWEALHHKGLIERRYYAM